MLATLHEVDRVFSTYRADSFVSRLGRGEIDVADCPPEVAEVLALGERARVESGGAFDVAGATPTGARFLDPSGVVKGWAVDRAAAALHALDDTDFCLSAGGDMVCPRRGPRAARLAGRHRGPARPHPDPAPWCPLRDGAVATSGLAHRGAHIVDARTGRRPDRASPP